MTASLSNAIQLQAICIRCNTSRLCPRGEVGQTLKIRCAHCKEPVNHILRPQSFRVEKSLTNIPRPRINTSSPEVGQKAGSPPPFAPREKVSAGRMREAAGCCVSAGVDFGQHTFRGEPQFVFVETTGSEPMHDPAPLIHNFLAS